MASTQPPQEAFLNWLRTFVEYVVTKRGLIMTIKSALGRESELFQLCRATIREGAQVVLAAAQEAGMIRQDVEATDLLKLAHAIATVAQHASEPLSEAERLLDLMLGGLRRQPEPHP